LAASGGGLVIFIRTCASYNFSLAPLSLAPVYSRFTEDAVDLKEAKAPLDELRVRQAISKPPLTLNLREFAAVHESPPGPLRRLMRCNGMFRIEGQAEVASAHSK